MKAQTILNEEMKSLITNYNAGAVATVNQDGSPAVSPKATFVIVDDGCIAYGDIRSPGTTNNIKRKPVVEIIFTDVLARRAVRVTGVASIAEKNSEQGKMLMPFFQRNWAPYLEAMQCFVSISISRAELILSPAYDVGFSKEELMKVNLEKINKIVNDN
jgi:general stress protein 26